MLAREDEESDALDVTLGQLICLQTSLWHPPDLCGVLEKQGRSNGQWKARYFTLKGSNLFWFSQPTARKPRGHVPLEGASVHAVRPPAVSIYTQHMLEAEQMIKPVLFGILVILDDTYAASHGGRQELVVAAGSSELQALWVKALQQASIPRPQLIARLHETSRLADILGEEPAPNAFQGQLSGRLAHTHSGHMSAAGLQGIAEEEEINSNATSTELRSMRFGSPPPHRHNAWVEHRRPLSDSGALHGAERPHRQSFAFPEMGDTSPADTSRAGTTAREPHGLSQQGITHQQDGVAFDAGHDIDPFAGQRFAGLPYSIVYDAYGRPVEVTPLNPANGGRPLFSRGKSPLRARAEKIVKGIKGLFGSNRKLEYENNLMLNGYVDVDGTLLYDEYGQPLDRNQLIPAEYGYAPGFGTASPRAFQDQGQLWSPQSSDGLGGSVRSMGRIAGLADSFSPMHSLTPRSMHNALSTSSQPTTPTGRIIPPPVGNIGAVGGSMVHNMLRGLVSDRNANTHPVGATLEIGSRAGSPASPRIASPRQASMQPQQATPRVTGNGAGHAAVAAEPTMSQVDSGTPDVPQAKPYSNARLEPSFADSLTSKEGPFEDDSSHSTAVDPVASLTSVQQQLAHASQLLARHAGKLRDDHKSGSSEGNAKGGSAGVLEQAIAGLTRARGNKNDWLVSAFKQLQVSLDQVNQTLSAVTGLPFTNTSATRTPNASFSTPAEQLNSMQSRQALLSAKQQLELCLETVRSQQAASVVSNPEQAEVLSAVLDTLQQEVTKLSDHETGNLTSTATSGSSQGRSRLDSLLSDMGRSTRSPSDVMFRTADSVCLHRSPTQRLLMTGSSHGSLPSLPLPSLSQGSMMSVRGDTWGSQSSSYSRLSPDTPSRLDGVRVANSLSLEDINTRLSTLTNSLQERSARTSTAPSASRATGLFSGRDASSLHAAPGTSMFQNDFSDTITAQTRPISTASIYDVRRLAAPSKASELAAVKAVQDMYAQHVQELAAARSSHITVSLNNLDHTSTVAADSTKHETQERQHDVNDGDMHLWDNPTYGQVDSSNERISMLPNSNISQQRPSSVSVARPSQEQQHKQSVMSQPRQSVAPSGAQRSSMLPRGSTARVSIQDVARASVASSMPFMEQEMQSWENDSHPSRGHSSVHGRDSFAIEETDRNSHHSIPPALVPAHYGHDVEGVEQEPRLQQRASFAAAPPYRVSGHQPQYNMQEENFAEYEEDAGYDTMASELVPLPGLDGASAMYNLMNNEQLSRDAEEDSTQTARSSLVSRRNEQTMRSSSVRSVALPQNARLSVASTNIELPKMTADQRQSTASVRHNTAGSRSAAPSIANATRRDLASSSLGLSGMPTSMPASSPTQARVSGSPQMTLQPAPGRSAANSFAESAVSSRRNIATSSLALSGMPAGPPTGMMFDSEYTDASNMMSSERHQAQYKDESRSGFSFSSVSQAAPPTNVSRLSGMSTTRSTVANSMHMAAADHETTTWQEDQYRLPLESIGIGRHRHADVAEPKASIGLSAIFKGLNRGSAMSMVEPARDSLISDKQGLHGDDMDMEQYGHFARDMYEAPSRRARYSSTDIC